MKTTSIISTLSLAAFMLFAVGCKKQAETVTPVDNSVASSNYEADVVIHNADAAYLEPTIAGGTETDAFYAENDGLPEAYTLIEMDMDDAGFKRTDKHFFACLKNLELKDTQIHMIRRALRAYEECKAADIKSHREAYAKLVTRIEASRKELLAKLNNNTITKAQFEEGMAKLRKDFQESLRYFKASYGKNLKACYDKFLHATKEILTERQWKAFVNCYR